MYVHSVSCVKTSKQSLLVFYLQIIVKIWLRVMHFNDLFPKQFVYLMRVIPLHPVVSTFNKVRDEFFLTKTKWWKRHFCENNVFTYFKCAFHSLINVDLAILHVHVRINNLDRLVLVRNSCTSPMQLYNFFLLS